MIQNTDELKAFIEWAKAQKIQSFDIQGIKVVFSPQAFERPAILQALQEISNQESKSDPEDVDEQTLFWSS